MSKVLVFAEIANGQIKKGALELLTAARAASLTTQVLVLGTGAKAAAGTLGGWGVNEAFAGDNAAFDQYNPEVFAETVAGVIKDSGADTV
ncbi:MAG: electron transfer flavoprotein subunit alpha/FixB family protein, partial [Bdellovibrionales bacterium]|nr:electron transfer flavoprotein subunit alpha/FixB family protein [Bdellovibrionales bacterium]